MKYFMNTFRGYYDVTDKIIEDGYRFINENFLINPNPMTIDYEELIWIRENLYEFIKKSYPAISKTTLDKIQTITVDEIKLRPYIFTTYSHTFDEDVYLLKIIDSTNNIYNIYIIKFHTMEGVYKGDEIIDHKLIQKIRLENEKWYRNFYENEDEYKKKCFFYSISTTETSSQNRTSSFLLTDKEKIVYRTYEGQNYTYDEWKIFEDEQYKVYKEKRDKKRISG